jgi:hypothetical protein
MTMWMRVRLEDGIQWTVLMLIVFFVRVRMLMGDGIVEMFMMPGDVKPSQTPTVRFGSGEGQPVPQRRQFT